MKMFLSLAVICFAINSGMGAPPKGRYMFVKCQPWENNSNCVTHRGPEIELSADLPDKLPASVTQHIGAQPVEEVEDGPVTVEKQPEVESVLFSTEDGSGGSEGFTGFEGSAIESPMADGSGDNWTQPEGDVKADYQPAEEELTEDQLLDL